MDRWWEVDGGKLVVEIRLKDGGQMVDIWWTDGGKMGKMGFNSNKVWKLFHTIIDPKYVEENCSISSFRVILCSKNINKKIIKQINK